MKISVPIKTMIIGIIDIWNFKPNLAVSLFPVPRAVLYPVIPETIANMTVWMKYEKAVNILKIPA